MGLPGQPGADTKTAIEGATRGPDGRIKKL
jgi:hypothetical protein